MTLVVHTARVSSRDPDRLDVTRKSGREGLFLAPSWAVLGPALEARRVGGEAWAVAWSTYQRAYLAEMRRSYVEHRAQWDALLARPRVVLCCYCVDSAHCHRALLARGILPKLGATNGGEL